MESGLIRGSRPPTRASYVGSMDRINTTAAAKSATAAAKMRTTPTSVLPRREGFMGSMLAP